MILSTFAQLGDKNVISVGYLKKIKVKGLELLVELEPGCWVGNRCLGISVSGRNAGGGTFKSKRSFAKATLDDLEKLIKTIKLEKCKKKACKKLFVKGAYDRSFNPGSLCQSHRLEAIDAAAAEEETIRVTESLQYNARKKMNGYRYKAVIWIHDNKGDDYSVLRYFKTKPTKVLLRKIAQTSRSKIVDDFTVTKI